MGEDQLLSGIEIVSLLLACIASTGTRALSDFSAHDLEELCRKRNHMERLREVFQHYRRTSIAAELCEVLMLIVVVASVVVQLSGRWPEEFVPASLLQLAFWRDIALPGVGAVFAILCAVVFVPRAISLLWATQVAYYFWPIWRFLERAVKPLLIVDHIVDVIFARSAGIPLLKESEEQFEEEIRTLVSEGEREGLLEEEAREMIEGVIKLGDVSVSEIMTPRTEMVCVPANLTWDEMLECVIREGHSRVPVYEETSDNIIGVLYIKDLLPYLTKTPADARPPWTTLLREPLFVPETKPVDALMQEFQRTHNHMAVVLDEYGGVSGVITMEDILEEIVGEIGDELDQETVQPIIVRGDGQAEVSGTTRVEEVNRRLDLELPEDDEYDTIAGLLMTHLGRVPRMGESIVFGKVRITVVEGDRRRIRRVLIESEDVPASDGTNG